MPKHIAVAELFGNRVGVIATMHRKEQVMAPILEGELGVKIIVPTQFDTDRFGTFTRDIKRQGDQLEAARFKAKAALDMTGETLAFASEGSFVPHPFLPGIYLNRELVILWDKKHDLEVVGQELCLETNFNHQTIKSLAEAEDFAQKVGFPEHGLLVMLHQECQSQDEMIKGIMTREGLAEAVSWGLMRSPSNTIHIETDMRAHYNPTRMNAIARATRDLIQKLNQFCPRCSWPNFELVERKDGLPCAACNYPTSVTLLAIYYCKNCGYSEQKLFPDNVETADPSRCEYCNP
jgi:ribosomal protein S27AE/DNA-directed RNA polymerase subunit RPC12/RpoP